MTTTTARYRWKLLRAGRFRLDGGSMFGLIPRSVWTRTVTPDDRGRIEVQHNCLLLERAAPDPAGKAPQRVLIETGTGNKLDAKNRDLFAMEDRSILDALREVDVAPESIDAVIVTHLHFDHAGGLTRLALPGETPDWNGPASTFGAPRPEQGVKRTFPNAEVVVQRREWEDALANRSVMTRTYFPDHLEPIREQVRLVDSPRPFAPGIIPDRDQMPLAPVSLRETELWPGSGVSVFLAPGHTWGQQAIKFIDDQGRTVVFTPDVLPTAAHNGAAYNLGYDVEPYTSMITRRWFLDAAAEDAWTLVLDHEAGNPVYTVRRNDKGWYDLSPVAEYA